MGEGPQALSHTKTSLWAVLLPVLAVVLWPLLVLFAPLFIVLGLLMYIRNRSYRKRALRVSRRLPYTSAPPDGLRPLELGLLLDHKFSNNEIVSVVSTILCPDPCV